ncbi:IS3 family transposase, partial [Corynebacterium sp.]|uniref:IS3 family transposase n=1 Tax=Corynebacterium sp. TaxID=1720 RepID=UPI00345DEB4E
MPTSDERYEPGTRVGKVFAGSDDVYGVFRGRAQLAREGTEVTVKTVATLMLRQGLGASAEGKVHPGDHDSRC